MTRRTKLAIAAAILAILALGTTAYVCAPGPIELQVRVHYAWLRNNRMADLNRQIEHAPGERLDLAAALKWNAHALRVLDRDEQRDIAEARTVDRTARKAWMRTQRSFWLEGFR
jgi:hypothetical protein